MERWEIIEDSWDLGWQVKKFFSELYQDGDDRNFLITKNNGWEGELKNICGEYMKIGMGMDRKKFKWK